MVHPLYNKRKMDTHNDIALLRMKANAQKTDYVEPICLPLDPSLWSTKDYTEDVFEVSGWGRPDSRECSVYSLYFSIAGKTETSAKSSIKLKVALPFFPSEACQEQYQAQNRIINDNQVH